MPEPPRVSASVEEATIAEADRALQRALTRLQHELDEQIVETRETRRTSLAVFFLLGVATGVAVVGVGLSDRSSSTFEALLGAAGGVAAAIAAIAAVASARRSRMRARGPRPSVGLALKRVFDFAVAFLGVWVALPLLGTIVLALKVEAPRLPAVVGVPRIGAGGRPFRLLVFRTRDAFSELSFVGQILRRLAFDQLPQLLNVLRGDMSLVGPIPLPPEWRIQLGWAPRPSMRPGMTGLAQLADRPLSAEELERLEEAYERNWSFGLDLRALGRSLRVAPALLLKRSN